MGAAWGGQSEEMHTMLSRHAISIVIVITAMPLMAAATPGPTIIYVDDDNCPGPGDGSIREPHCSIQTAINAAVLGDEVIVAEGEYSENINFLGKAITVRSTDPNDAVVVMHTIIQASDTVVTCESGEGPDTVLSGFVITSGTASGMKNTSSSPTVTNCSFIRNTAAIVGGGGMSNTFCSPTVTNCWFSGNTADLGTGGGMHNIFSSPVVSLPSTHRLIDSKHACIHLIPTPLVSKHTRA